jgi:hypothetical protein
MNVQNEIAEARHYELKQEVDDARRILLRMLEANLDNVHAWIAWLQFLLRNAQAEETLTECTRACIFFPANPALVDLSVSVYLANSMYGEAYDLVNKLHADRPDHPINFDRLARIYRFTLASVCESIEKGKQEEQEKVRLVSLVLRKHFLFLKELCEKRKTKLLFVNGNCQSWPLMRILNSHEAFRSHYVTVCYKTIHTMTQIEMAAVGDVLDIFDIVLTQNIKNRTKFNPLVTTSLQDRFPAKVLTFPTCWFSSYFPDAFATSGVECPQFPYDLHSKRIFRSYTQGRSLQDAINHFENSKISAQDIEKLLAENYCEIAERDVSLDIKIADHIAGNYRNSQLFYTFNHCSIDLLGFIANQICAHFSLPRLDIGSIARYEGLDGVVWYVPAEVQESLGLKFMRNYFVLNKRQISLADFVRDSYSYYAGLGEKSIVSISDLSGRQAEKRSVVEYQ